MRWKILNEIDDQQRKTANILSAESKDGNAKNVVRFSQEQLTNITPGDRAKADSGHSLVENMVAKCEANIKEVREKRSHLFDMANVVRPLEGK